MSGLCVWEQLINGANTAHFNEILLRATNGDRLLIFLDNIDNAAIEQADLLIQKSYNTYPCVAVYGANVYELSTATRLLILLILSTMIKAPAPPPATAPLDVAVAIEAISRELHEPLNSILGVCAMPITPDHMQVIKKCSMRAARTLNNMLDYSRLLHQSFKLLPESYNVVTVFENCRQYMAGSGRDIQLKFAGFNSGMFVVLDGERLTQIIINIVTFSTTRTKKSNTIRISVMAEHNRLLHITIRDNGIGLGQDADTIFDYDIAAAAATTPPNPPQHIELCITRRIIELMGGTIRADSEENFGTDFHFTIPFISPHIDVWGMGPTTDLESILGGHGIKYSVVASINDRVPNYVRVVIFENPTAAASTTATQLMIDRPHLTIIGVGGDPANGHCFTVWCGDWQCSRILAAIVATPINMAAPIDLTNESPRKVGTDARSIQSIVASNPFVLIVDTIDNSQILLRDLMKTFGFTTVQMAGTAEYAINVVQATKLRLLIIIDVSMPRISDILASAPPNCRIVLVGGTASTRNDDRFKAYPAATYVARPISRHSLEYAIRGPCTQGPQSL